MFLCVCLFLFNPNLIQHSQRNKNVHTFPNSHTCSGRSKETWKNRGEFLLNTAGEIRSGTLPAESGTALNHRCQPATFISQWSHASGFFWKCAVMQSIAHAFVSARAGGEQNRANLSYTMSIVMLRFTHPLSWRSPRKWSKWAKTVNPWIY